MNTFNDDEKEVTEGAAADAAGTDTATADEAAKEGEEVATDAE